MKKFYRKECESVSEYFLPDYMGDVKKVLTVSAKAQPSSKFVSEGHLECSGIVSYDILYSDSEGKLTCATVSSDYDISVPIDSDSYIDSLLSSSVSSTSLRLNGPRRLICKSVVSNSITVNQEDSVATLGNAFADGTVPEVERARLNVENRIFSAKKEREYAEEAERLANVTANDVEIIATSGAVRILESEPQDGAVKVKGEMIITVILRTVDQPPFAIRKTVPFEENVDFSAFTPGMQVVSEANLTSVSAGVADDGGVGSVVTVSAICEAWCVAAENREITPIKDAYLKNRDTETTYRDISYTELVGMGSSEEAFELAIRRDEVGCEKIRDVLTVGFELRDVEYKVDRSSIEISANAHVSGIACEINDNDAEQYIPIKFTSPITLRIGSGASIPENAEIELSLTPVEARHTVLEDQITLKCSVGVRWSVSRVSTARVLSECNLVGDMEYPPARSTITVYYPEGDETLFDIAKRYHTTRAKIAADNDLSEATVATSGAISSLGIKKLIIR